MQFDNMPESANQLNYSSGIFIHDRKYFVMKTGDVISFARKRPTKLIGKINKGGYRMIILTLNKRKKYILTHRLIAQIFILNPKNKSQVNHKNGVKIDNRISNLEWVTAKENGIHARDHGLQRSKINMRIANKIRKMYQTEKYSHRGLASLFNISKSSVYGIINNKRWGLR